MLAQAGNCSVNMLQKELSGLIDQLVSVFVIVKWFAMLNDWLKPANANISFKLDWPVMLFLFWVCI